MDEREEDTGTIVAVEVAISDSGSEVEAEAEAEDAVSMSEPGLGLFLPVVEEDAVPTTLNCCDCARMPLLLGFLDSKLIWYPSLQLDCQRCSTRAMANAPLVNARLRRNGVRALRGLDVGGDGPLDGRICCLVDEDDRKVLRVGAARVGSCPAAPECELT